MTKLLLAVFTAYIATVVVTSSSLLEPGRRWLIARTPRLQISPTHPHFIECRLCVGFWVCLILCLALGDLRLLGFVYGASYFLATQER